ncbi:hypothetical protein G7Y89_g5875 [Cudoniella acicularis]|uniref:Uncharacterized protein n=1 Tax=Cudoniella acicularis TaxID=354080 RepID=A0A8H4RPW2_9HELO|nr:hypothetical protein G7Y89_g5875 [Cudoniella acicularis]
MSARDRWIDVAMATYEGSSQLCGFCGSLFHVKLDFQGDMGRMSEESKPCQSVEDFEKADNSFANHVLDGCHLCWLFWLYLSEDTRTGIEEAEWIEYNVIRPRTSDNASLDIQGLQQMWKSSDEGPPLGWSDLMLLVPDTGKSQVTSGSDLGSQS